MDLGEDQLAGQPVGQPALGLTRVPPQVVLQGFLLKRGRADVPGFPPGGHDD